VADQLKKLTLDDVLYPSIEPYKSGHLDVGDGHQIYYEQCGNPQGKPALFLHGGPGAGSSPNARRLFDPKVYMICVFDQRGCNRSKPNAAEDLWGSLKANTTQHLVEDCELLRKACGLSDPWHVVVGGSWGVTLAVAYAQTYPNMVKSLVLRGVFTGDQEDVDHLFNSGSMEQHHPEAWEAYTKHIIDTAESPEALKEDQRCYMAGYYRRLTSGDASKAAAAAAAVTGYELLLIKNERDDAFINRVLEDPLALIPCATFELHYSLNHFFMSRHQLLDGCSKLSKDLRVRIAHGRCDFVTRPIAAWRLARSMRTAGLTDVSVNMVPGTAHHDSEPMMAAAMVEAVDELKE